MCLIILMQRGFTPVFHMLCIRLLSGYWVQCLGKWCTCCRILIASLDGHFQTSQISYDWVDVNIISNVSSVWEYFCQTFYFVNLFYFWSAFHYWFSFISNFTNKSHINFLSSLLEKSGFWEHHVLSFLWEICLAG